MYTLFFSITPKNVLGIICFKMLSWLAIPISYPTSSTFSLPHNILTSLKRNYRDDFQVHLLDEPTDLFRKPRYRISILWTRSAASRVRDSINTSVTQT